MMKFTVSDQAEKEIRRLRHENARKRVRIRELEAEIAELKGYRPEGMFTLGQTADAIKAHLGDDK
jgi:hypothetical protein